MNDLDFKMIRILWSTRRPLLLAILLFTAGFLVTMLVLVPQFNEAMALYNNMQKEEPKLEKLEKKLAELQDIELSPEFAQVEIVNNALPSRKPLLELLVALDSVSQETGTKVKNFQLTPGLVASDSTVLSQSGKAGSAYDSLSLELTVQGTFQQIQDFLLKVEEAAPFTTIVSMEIGNQLNANAPGFDELADDPVFEAVLTNETYFFTQPIAARIDSPLPKIAARELEVLNLLASFVPTDLPEQTEIRGGGLEDLFQVESLLGTPEEE